MGCLLSSDWCEEGKVVSSWQEEREGQERSVTMKTTKPWRAEPHVFREKSFKKKRVCCVCRQNIDGVGSFCRLCKSTTHRKCEAKLTSACSSLPASDLPRRATVPSRPVQHLGSTGSLTLPKQRAPLPKQRAPLPRSLSVDRVIDGVMERRYDLHLTYITERIISVFFSPELEENKYRLHLREVTAMLTSKHHHHFLLLNLSERRHDLSRLHHKVRDFGWPDLHAPPLDRICSICKEMETWLSSHPQHVVVLHCKGNRGKTGVIIAAYIHYSNISAGADQALSTLAMRKFCEDKVWSSLQPSQNRYLYYFGGLLSGTIKMNSSPLFLHHVLLPSLPRLQDTGYFLFLKVYQSMQLVYTSGIYSVGGRGGRRVCVTMDPALLLKGDIMVKCYQRRHPTADRHPLFRLQFHTCTVHSTTLDFRKQELDQACSDERFPSEATVELIFSSGPEKTKGSDLQRNPPGVTVDYNTADPVVRWDSYENLNQRYQDSLEADVGHTPGPVDGSLYAQIKKRRGLSPGTGHAPLDSAHSFCFSQPSRDHTEPDPPLPPTRQEREELERLLGGIEGAGEDQRETAILDDGESVSSERSRTRISRSCSCREGYRSKRCAQPGCDRTLLMPNGYCLDGAPGTNGHHGAPAELRTAHPPSHMDLCQHYSPLPPPPHPPDLLWERQRGAPLQRGCSEGPSPRHVCPYPPPHFPPHHHPCPAPTPLYCGEDDYPIYPHPHHLKPPTSPPYQDILVVDAPPPPGCLCRDCSFKREDAVYRGVNDSFPWGREAELRQREAGLKPKEGLGSQWDGHARAPSLHWEREAELHWDGGREADCWHRRGPPPYGSQSHVLSAFSFDPLPSDHPAYPQGSRFPPHMEVKYSSSGYLTPCQHCPPYQPSPSDSRGYASGYQSESTSPLPPPSSLTGTCSHAHYYHDLHSPSQSYPDAHPDGGWRGPLSHGWRTSHRHAPCSTPSDMSGPPTPVHSSSPLRTQDSPGPVERQGGVRSTDIIERQGGVRSTDIIDCEAFDEDHESEETPGCSSEQSEPPSNNSSPSNPPHVDSGAPPHANHPSLQTVASTLCHSPAHSPPPSKEGGRPPSQKDAPSAEPPPLSSSKDAPSAEPPPLSSSKDAPSAEPPPLSSSKDGSLDQDTPVPGFATLGRRLMLSRSEAPQPYQPLQYGPPHHHHPPPDPALDTTLWDHNSHYLQNYSTISIPLPHPLPGLPEKGHAHNSPPCCEEVPPVGPSSSQHHVTFSPSVGGGEGAECVDSSRVSVKFVQDSSKFWYKPNISREQAVLVLKDRGPGSFLIRDSNSFQGAYGLALKVATPPANANNHNSKGGDPLEQLVRHFLIETGPRGVKIKGCHNEPCFGSLSALVYQHSITPLSLPCSLHIPQKELIKEETELQPSTNISTAADLLKQGAACNVLYLSSVETETLTGPQAVAKAAAVSVGAAPRPSATVVQFKVTSQGVTLTDSQRRVFFRRHYPVNTLTFSSLDPHHRRWTDSDVVAAKVFGFVAKKPGSLAENVCHLFADLDPEQPADAIVSFINRVLLAQRH